MQLFLTLVLVIRFCKHHHPCCPLGNQPGCTLQRLPLQRLPHAMMMTLAATSAMTQMFLGVHVSVQTVGVHMYPLHLFWGQMRSMKTFVLYVAAKIHFMPLGHVLLPSLTVTILAQCVTHLARHFGARNRASHALSAQCIFQEWNDAQCSASVCSLQ